MCLFRPATFVNVTFVLNQTGWSLTEKQEFSKKKKRQNTYLHTYTLHIVNFVKQCINSVLFEYLNCCSAVWKSLKSKIVLLQYSRNLLTRLLFLFPTSLKVKYMIQQHTHKKVNKCEGKENGQICWNISFKPPNTPINYSIKNPIIISTHKYFSATRNCSNIQAD